MTMLGNALQYAARGWYIFPCKPDKAPFTEHGFKDGTVDPATIKAFWTRWPNAGIGVDCGRSGLVVVDLDVKAGPNGIANYEAIMGPEEGYRGTYLSRTPSGGLHCIYSAPSGTIPCSAGKLAKGVDCKSTGGYILLPPSRTSAGHYEALNDWTGTPGPLPPKLAELLTAAGGDLTGLESATFPPPMDREAIFAGLPDGSRDDGLYRYCCSLRARNLEREEAALLVLAAARQAKPPFPEKEALAKLESAWKYPPGTSLDNNLQEQARTLVEDAKIVPPSDEEAGNLNKLPLSDSGQGEALLLLHGDRLRFDHTRGAWLLWTPPTWAPDETEQTIAIALAVARSRLAASAQANDPDRRQALARWALRSENHGNMLNALVMAASMAPIAVTSKRFDRDPYLLAVANGIVDLRSATLREGKPEDMITLIAPVPYSPEAKCPRWLLFLEEIFEGDRELIAFIQRSVGYSLTGDCREQCLFLLHGTGANGKSVFLATLGRLLGAYAAVTPFQTFLASKFKNDLSNDLAALRGVRLVSACETKEGSRLDEALVKRITGQDPITARFLNHEFFTFRPQAKIWLAANSKPVIAEITTAIWRRIRLVPFNASFPPGKADLLLEGKLLSELPGILSWAVQGCLAWQREGLGLPAQVREATAGYREESDILARFLEDCTTQEGGASAKAGDLYKTYREWAATNGEYAISGTAFGRRLSEKGFAKTHERRGATYIGLRVSIQLNTWPGEV